MWPRLFGRLVAYFQAGCGGRPHRLGRCAIADCRRQESQEPACPRPWRPARRCAPLQPPVALANSDDYRFLLDGDGIAVDQASHTRIEAGPGVAALFTKTSP
jgi:hypothetical protein